jgi:hypothetical protein
LVSEAFIPLAIWEKMELAIVVVERRQRDAMNRGKKRRSMHGLHALRSRAEDSRQPCSALAVDKAKR